MKLLFLNGSRGEWGYIRPVIRRCVARGIDYAICATNMTVLPGYGSLVDEIKRDGFTVSDELFMSLEGGNHFTMAKSLGVFLSSFVDTLYRVRPNWIVLAGDRGEQLVGAMAGAYTYIPVAHIQAGERSGNIDGVTRHAIAKFAHLHFAANADAAERLLRLGEEPFRVHQVGAPQLDELADGSYTPWDEIARRFGIAQPFLLVVQHPVTEEMHRAAEQVQALAAALARFPFQKVWILPNNDAGGQTVRREVLRARRSGTLSSRTSRGRTISGFSRAAPRSWGTRARASSRLRPSTSPRSISAAGRPTGSRAPTSSTRPSTPTRSRPRSSARSRRSSGTRSGPPPTPMATAALPNVSSTS